MSSASFPRVGSPPPVAFGRPLRARFALDPGAIFLNHGSFGACPREVTAAQDLLRGEMEAQPDAFFRERIMPGGEGTPLRAAIGELANFVGTAAARLALVENATVGVQAVLRSLAFAPGDEILVTDHTYNAVRLIVEARCRETGAVPRVVTLPWPASADDLVERFAAVATPRLRLAVLDHITSPTALALPLARIAAALRRHGARVLVDGAHAVGHLPLDLDRLGVDWYVSNAHKWLYAPRGTAFLYASPEAAGQTQPPVTSHYVGLGFPLSFDYVGTRDYTAWLALPAAIRFHAALDRAAAARYRAGLVAFATRCLEPLGARPVAGDDLACAMRSFLLPQARAATAADAEALVKALWTRHRIQSMAVCFAGRLLLRVSAQVYVGEEDIDALAAALAQDGWPARSPG